MADLKGTKTEENLRAALAGESQARVKYEFYASQAKKDGYVEIKDIFQESSDNEKEHAKIWFKLLNGGKVPDTLSNLADAAAGEHEEWTVMYKEFAETAREEGFDDIADLFDAAGATEKVGKLIANTGIGGGRVLFQLLGKGFQFPCLHEHINQRVRH